jgi:hypothetical protein
VRGLVQRGDRVTQETIAAALAARYPKASGADDRRLREWCNTFGLDYEALVQGTRRAR